MDENYTFAQFPELYIHFRGMDGKQSSCSFGRVDSFEKLQKLFDSRYFITKVPVVFETMIIFNCDKTVLTARYEKVNGNKLHCDTRKVAFGESSNLRKSTCDQMGSLDVILNGTMRLQEKFLDYTGYYFINASMENHRKKIIITLPYFYIGSMERKEDWIATINEGRNIFADFSSVNISALVNRGKDPISKMELDGETAALWPEDEMRTHLMNWLGDLWGLGF